MLRHTIIMMITVTGHSLSQVRPSRLQLVRRPGVITVTELRVTATEQQTQQYSAELYPCDRDIIICLLSLELKWQYGINTRH